MRATYWLVVAVVLTAALLRFAALGQAGRFHPDEALFATFARGAALNGDWLLPGALDKPPLSIYATALAMALLADSEAAPGLPDITPRTGEFAARLPTLFASLLVVALSYRLALQLYGQRRVALLAALLVACSPFAIAFAPTAFTDGWLLLWLVAALVSVSARRWAWAGLWLGLGLWTKQQAAFYLPLVIALGWLVETRSARLRRVLTTGGILVGMLALLALWDTARQQASGIWALAAANNDPWRWREGVHFSDDLRQWLAYGGWLLSVPPLTWGLVGSGGWAAVHGQRTDRLLAAFVLIYVAAHGLLAFDPYDRYLLPLLPPLVLLAARGIDALMGGVSAHMRPVMWLLLGGLLALSGLIGASGGAPVGGDRGEHDGIDRAAGFLDSRTLGAIIYDRWLGWELDYYLGEWTDKRRVYYPTPDLLSEDALRQPDPAPRYFVAPRNRDYAVWLETLHDAAFTSTLAYDRDSFVIYELLPPWNPDRR